MRLALAFLSGALLLTGTVSAGNQPTPVETKVVPTGTAPCGLAGEPGSVWVGVYEAGALLSIAPQGRVTRRITVGEAACRIALDSRYVWVTRDRANEIVRITRSTGELDRIEVDPQPFDVLRAEGSVWVTGYETGAIARIDPRTTRRTATVRVGPNPAGLAACGGRIWAGHGRGATWITSIDPATLRVRRITVGARTPGWPHCIRGSLWVTTQDTVIRLDPQTGRVLSRLRIGDTLADAAAGPDGLVWVTDKQHSIVHRVSSDGRSVVDSFPAGPGAFALARMGDSMWVTSFAGSDVRKFEP